MEYPMVSLLEYANKLDSEGKQEEAQVLRATIQEYRLDDYDPSPNHRNWKFERILKTYTKLT